MNRTQQGWLTTALLVTFACAEAAPPVPVEEVPGVNLPAVPASVTQTPTLDALRQRQNQERTEGVAADSRVQLTVQPGVTELVPIARNYMNHIVTPFEDPKVITVNPIEFKKEGSSVYLATSSERPVGIEIRSNDPDDTRGISLALIPKAIPPRTVTVRWAGQGTGVSLPVSSARARRWEESAPYEEKLIELAQKTARGEIPEGYSLSDTVEQLSCQLTDVKFFTGQQLTGSHFTVYVLKATNIGTSRLEMFGNAGCSMPGVVFVAPYPVAHLDPGGATEVYVIASNDSFQASPRANYRPSLLQR